MSIGLELVGVWLTIVAYVIASVASTIGVVFGKPRSRDIAAWIALVGLTTHSVVIVSRWIRVGHGPYLGFYEVASLLAWMAVAGFLLAVWRYRALALGGVVVFPLAFLIMGGTLLVNAEAREVTGSLSSIWLAIHVIFANLAFGAYAVSCALAVAYLLKERSNTGRLAALLERFPAPDDLDALTFRFIGAGFVFQSVMLASGAIWANEAWGRYWGWDPVETWSLIAWAIYAIYLHLTLTLGWRGRRAAWIAVLALPVSLFSLLGVPLVYHSIHGAYLAR